MDEPRGKARIDVSKVERSFKWDSFKDGKPYLGTFHQEIKGKVKMHTQKLNLDDWVKIDRTYASQQREKERLLESFGRHSFFVSNEDATTESAKNEFLQLLIAYLPRRFPDKFERRDGGIYNKMLEEWIGVSRDKGVVDPLLRASRLTQEDWCIMEWNENHVAYVLTAACVFFPMRWSLQEKWNQPMIGIHKQVDAFVNHLANGVAALFKSMSPDAPVYRGNWMISKILDGPLDLYKPSYQEKTNPEISKVSRYEGSITGRKLMCRTEYQTLRKLPRSKAIVFSIRTYQFYLEDFKQFPREDAEALINAVETMHPDFVTNKSVALWRDASTEYLRRHVLGEGGGGGADDGEDELAAAKATASARTRILNLSKFYGAQFYKFLYDSNFVKIVGGIGFAAVAMICVAKLRR